MEQDIVNGKQIAAHSQLHIMDYIELGIVHWIMSEELYIRHDVHEKGQFRPFVSLADVNR